jgi:hypothetical protein
MILASWSKVIIIWTFKALRREIYHSLRAELCEEWSARSFRPSTYILIIRRHGKERSGFIGNRFYFCLQNLIICTFRCPSVHFIEDPGSVNRMYMGPYISSEPWKQTPDRELVILRLCYHVILNPSTITPSGWIIFKSTIWTTYQGLIKAQSKLSELIYFWKTTPMKCHVTTLAPTPLFVKPNRLIDDQYYQYSIVWFRYHSSLLGFLNHHYPYLLISGLQEETGLWEQSALFTRYQSSSISFNASRGS